MRHAAIAFLLLVAQAAPRPAFEVASIKRNTTVEPAFTLGFAPGGRFRAAGMDVRTLITIAYQQGTRLFPSQVIGLPGWAASDSWDINAKVSDDMVKVMSVSLRAQLLQSLLEDRFKLKIHREARDVQQYELVMANKEGALGPQLHRATVNCTVDVTQCETRLLPGQFTTTSMGIGGLAAFLASNVVRTVVTDKTGLVGQFSVSLEWAPESAAATDKASIFTALQDQLALKLEPVRSLADVVVVDRIERPAED